MIQVNSYYFLAIICRYHIRFHVPQTWIEQINWCQISWEVQK